jgi:catalase
MDTRRNSLMLAVPGALLGTMLSCTVFGDNLTRDNGASVGHNQNSQTAGPGGPVLQDVQLIQSLQPVDRERTPERVVQPRGAATKFYISEGNWDLVSNNRPVNTLTHLHSEFGIPASYQMMDGNSVDALKFVNAADEVQNVQFHWKTLHNGKQLARCEWHSSLSSKTLVGFRFSVRVSTFISAASSQALLETSGSISQEFSCSG